MATKPDVVIAVQSDYGAGNRQSHRKFWAGCRAEGSENKYKLFQDQLPSSYDVANIMLATALAAQEDPDFIKNHGMITHAAMLHNDVVPFNGWLDCLLDVMQATDADMVSVVAPIKDLFGLSSCAIDSVGSGYGFGGVSDPWRVERRISMTEIFRLPETFSIDDIPQYNGRPLLVNTGCFLLDYTKPWRYKLNELFKPPTDEEIEQMDAETAKAALKTISQKYRDGDPGDGSFFLTFDSRDRIVRRPDGKPESQHSPADWAFSRRLKKLGAKVVATRKVRMMHMGELPYRNDEPWGESPIDRALVTVKPDGSDLKEKLLGTDENWMNWHKSRFANAIKNGDLPAHLIPNQTEQASKEAIEALKKEVQHGLEPSVGGSLTI